MRARSSPEVLPTQCRPVCSRVGYEAAACNAAIQSKNRSGIDGVFGAGAQRYELSIISPVLLAPGRLSTR
jgi:hypothetical protein